jgi:hypothetical protein
MDKENNKNNRIAYQDPTVTEVVHYLEANAATIRDEYKNQILSTTATKKIPSDYQDTDHGSKLHEGEWKWHSYLNKGSVRGQFAMDFPETAKILQPLRDSHQMFEGTPFGFCFFSSLSGQSKIKAHTSPVNMRLRLHLPLIVPLEEKETDDNDDEIIACGIRVANSSRRWTQDKALVLDDSYEHEVWNTTSETRVLLLVDLWHPDVSMLERQEIVGMFQEAKKQGMWKK